MPKVKGSEERTVRKGQREKGGEEIKGWRGNKRMVKIGRKEQRVITTHNILFICSLSIVRVHANIMLVSACFSDR